MATDKREARFLITAESKVPAELKKISGGLTSMQGQAVKLSANLAKVALGLVTIAGIKAFAGMIKDAADAVDTLGEQAERLGVTVGALQKYRVATLVAGASNEDLEKSLMLLNKNVGNLRSGLQKDDGGLAKAFERVGLSMDDVRKKSTEEIFDAVSEGLSKIPDQATRASTAMQIFGKGAGSMMLLFNSGSDQIRIAGERISDLGISLSKLDAQKIGEMNDHLDDLQLIADGAKQKLAVELAPAIGTVSEYIVDFIKKSGGVDKIMRTIVESTVSFADRSVAVYRIVKGESVVLFELLKAGFGGVLGASAATASFFVKAFTKDMPAGINFFLEKMEQAGKYIEIGFNKVIASVTGAVEGSVNAVIGGVEKMASAISGTTIKLDRVKIDAPELESKIKFGRLDENSASDIITMLDAVSEGAFEAGGDALKEMRKSAYETREDILQLFSGEHGDLYKNFMQAQKESDKLKETIAPSGGEDGVTGALGKAERAAKAIPVPFEKLEVAVQSQIRTIEYLGQAVSYGIEDSIDQMVDNGKIGFKELTASILKDIARIMAKQAVLNAMYAFTPKSAQGGIWGSVIKAFASSQGVTVPSADGGGFTGFGARSGGLDGKGGFAAVLHPNESIIDHTKGQGVGGDNISQTIIIRETMPAGIAEKIAQQAEARTLAKLQSINSRGGRLRRSYGMA